MAPHTTSRSIGRVKGVMQMVVSQIEEVNRIRLNCVRSDLVAGLTFSRVALQTRDRVTRDRNRQLALEAYNVLSDLMGELCLPPEDTESMTPMIQRLKSELESMGESF